MQSIGTSPWIWNKFVLVKYTYPSWEQVFGLGLVNKHLWTRTVWPEFSKTPQANQMALVRFRDSSSLISLGSALYLKLCWCCPVVIKKKRIHLPSKWRKSVKKVETYCDNLDGDQNENPESVLERLQEGNQLTGTRLLKYGAILSQMNFNNILVWKVTQTKLWEENKELGLKFKFPWQSVSQSWNSRQDSVQSELKMQSAMSVSQSQ